MLIAIFQPDDETNESGSDTDPSDTNGAQPEDKTNESGPDTDPSDTNGALDPSGLTVAIKPESIIATFQEAPTQYKLGTNF